MLASPLPDVQQTTVRPGPFWLMLAVLLIAAVAHTLWATSLDGFTVDEPYHLVAGATYLRTGDFRLNPEHPPLVKLAAALAEPSSVLHVGPFTTLDDKYQEREFTQTAVFLDSDGHQVRRRARFALIVLNTLLLGVAILLMRRVFGPEIALATLLLLALDPTVSAHMPVVMTDLPLALLGLSATCGVLIALRRQLWRDWLLFGLLCGLLLATKHSAPLIVLPLVASAVLVLLWRAWRERQLGTAAHLLRLTVAVALSVAVLWSFYGFRYHESRERDAQGRYTDTFNRTLELKIADLHSPLFRRTLSAATRAHLLPRAYVWGLADTLRAGIESRPQAITAFGHDYMGKAPWWVAFAFLLVKLPLGFVVLAGAGVALLCARKLPPSTARPLTALALLFAVFMAFIAKNGVFYAGVRHWLFSIPLLAVAAAVAAVHALNRPRPWVRLLPVLCLLWIAITVVPQRRIWEYHNVLAGGSRNAWKHFSNESVDLGQRNNEIMAFYNGHIAPQPVMLHYPLLKQLSQSGGFVRWSPTPAQAGDGHLTGWFLYDAPYMPAKDWHGVEALRGVEPTVRFGNAFLYHGTFYLPHTSAGALGSQAVQLMFSKHPDPGKEEAYLRRAVELAPDDSFGWLLLGNFAQERHNTADALAKYGRALKEEQDSEQVRQALREQIQAVQHNPNAPAMRLPGLE